jgi:rhodanese-related sulfurtransferase
MALFLEFLAEQWLLASALIVMLVLLFMHEQRKGAPALSPQQAINLVNQQQGIFLDLRDSKDFRGGHITDALNVPYGKLASSMTSLEAYRDRPVILVCRMGQHAGAASKQLQQAGFSQLYRMNGGMLEWTGQQLPVVKS